ncbi:glycosyltransferase family 4 protein [[Micrococcus luteus] ATCC 49442]|uniref:glycosyltransferase family 4 protein n=1 Tax=[Micrococcus luteus] ATCC 49442 TaxID=2698727 RepID=UPI003D6633A0
MTSDRDLGQTQSMDVVANSAQRWGASTVYYASPGLRSRLQAFGYARSFQARILYTNSFFDPVYSLLPLALWRIGLIRSQRFVVAPRGEFGPGALNIKRVKKKLFLGAFLLFRGGRGVLWHASSIQEAENIRAQIGRSAQIVVAEDNTALPMTAAEPSSPRPSLRAVVMGRMVPVKGVVELLRALAGVSHPLTVDIYGPEEDREYAAKCRDLAAELPAHIAINFRGPVPSAEVAPTLRTYDVMFLPTHGENFSHVVAEALSVSLPVMCADVTPWSSYIADGGGVLIKENKIGPWTEAIERYASLPAPSRLSYRYDAGKQYERWRASTAGQSHVFDLIMKTSPNLHESAVTSVNRVEY